MALDFERFFNGGSRAYLVGINQYQYVRTLETPLHDCEGLKEVLTEKHKFQVKLLKDATRSQFEEFLDLIEKDTLQDQNSRIIFYFAGHGIADGADEANQRPRGYLLLSDSQRGNTDTYMDMGFVLEKLAGLNNCHHLLIILDCCYAGAIKYAIDTRSLGFAVPKTMYKEKFLYYLENPAKQVITSAANDQKAVDSLGLRGKNENNRSPFAESLIDALQRGDGSWTYGNVKPDGIITASELGFFLSLDVSNQLTRRNIPFADQQTPSVFPLKDSGKGEFIFVESLASMEQLPTNPGVNPYKGLEAYTEKDKLLFYGRERVLKGWWEEKLYKFGLLPLIEKEIKNDCPNDAEAENKGEEQKGSTNNTNEAPRTFYRILVTGRSGIGKSSLVKAGVIAKLQQEGRKTEIITPGQTPFTTHKERLQQLAGASDLCYLLVDQYEELVTQCSDDKERQQFESALAGLADNKKAVVIITLRSDIERQLRDGAFLKGEDENKFYRFLVPNFSRDEIKEIIIQPAAQNLLEFKGNKKVTGKSEDEINNAFIEKMVDETFAYPDSLPMLSEALSKLYEDGKREGVMQLKEENYDAFGGIHGILSVKVKNVHDSLDELQKNLFDPFILRMISFDTGYLAKRRVFTFLKQDGIAINELEFSDPAINEAMKAIMDKLIRERLVSTTTNDKSANEEEYIEPSHDALVSDIDRIAQWQKESNATSLSGTTSVIPFQSRISTLTALANASRSYAFSIDKNSKGLLWKSDPRLEMVQHMVARKELMLNKIEETFVRDSYKAKVRGRYIERTVFVTILALMAIAGTIFIVQRNKVQQEKDNVQNRLALNYLENSEDNFNGTNQLNSLLMLAKAIEISKDTSMLSLMKQHFGYYDLSFRLNGVIKTDSPIRDAKLTENNRLLVLSCDSAVEIWDVINLKRIYKHVEEARSAMVNSSAAKLYVYTSKAIECWDLAKNTLLKRVGITKGSGQLANWDLARNRIDVSYEQYLTKTTPHGFSRYPVTHPQILDTNLNLYPASNKNVSSESENKNESSSPDVDISTTAYATMNFGDTDQSNGLLSQSFIYYRKLFPDGLQQGRLLIYYAENICFIYRNFNKQAVVNKMSVMHSNFSKNGKYCLVLDSNSKAWMKNVEDQNLSLEPLDTKQSFSIGRISSIVSDDGKIAVVASNDTGTILNFYNNSIYKFKLHNNSSRLQFSFPASYSGEFGFLGTSDTVVFSGEGFINFYDPHSGKVYEERKIPVSINDPKVLFAPDGLTYFVIDRLNILHRLSLLKNPINVSIVNLDKLKITDVEQVLPLNDQSALLLSRQHSKVYYYNKTAKPQLKILYDEVFKELALTRFLTAFISPDSLDEVKTTENPLGITSIGIDYNSQVFAIGFARRSLQLQLYKAYDATLICDLLYDKTYDRKINEENHDSSYFNNNLINYFYSAKDEKQSLINFCLIDSGIAKNQCKVIDNVTNRAIGFTDNDSNSSVSLGFSAYFNNEKLRIFNGKTIIDYGSDIDLPDSLLRLQIAVMTGTELNSGNEATAISPGVLADKWQQYLKEAAAHLKECKYKPYNLYKQCMNTPLY